MGVPTGFLVGLLPAPRGPNTGSRAPITDLTAFCGGPGGVKYFFLLDCPPHGPSAGLAGVEPSAGLAVVEPGVVGLWHPVYFAG